MEDMVSAVEKRSSSSFFKEGVLKPSSLSLQFGPTAVQTAANKLRNAASKFGPEQKVRRIGREAAAWDWACECRLVSPHLCERASPDLFSPWPVRRRWPTRGSRRRRVAMSRTEGARFSRSRREAWAAGMCAWRIAWGTPYRRTCMVHTAVRKALHALSSAALPIPRSSTCMPCRSHSSASVCFPTTARPTTASSSRR